jgi:hypothetical protein
MSNPDSNNYGFPYIRRSFCIMYGSLSSYRPIVLEIGLSLLRVVWGRVGYAGTG